MLTEHSKSMSMESFYHPDMSPCSLLGSEWRTCNAHVLKAVFRLKNELIFKIQTFPIELLPNQCAHPPQQDRPGRGQGGPGWWSAGGGPLPRGAPQLCGRRGILRACVQAFLSICILSVSQIRFNVTASLFKKYRFLCRAKMYSLL